MKKMKGCAQMIDYLSNILHQNVQNVEDLKIELPLFLKSSYEFMSVTIFDITFLLATPIAEISLSMLKKHHEQIEQLTKMKCAFCYMYVRSYKLEKMIAYGIPFVVRDKFVYLPFLAIVLSERNKEVRRKKEKLMPKTQEALLRAMYWKWKCLSASELAEKLVTSRTNASRIFDEIESLQLNLIVMKKNTRYFMWEGTAENLWNLVKDFLHSPVKKTYNVQPSFFYEQDMGLKLSGYSALSKYSLLADNTTITTAISKHEEFKMRGKIIKKQGNEEDAMELQCYEYWVDYGADNIVDPLSAFLSLKKDEQNDPRVKMALDNIWKGIKNDTWIRKI